MVNLYGWVPDLPDRRDYQMSKRAEWYAEAPPSSDLSPAMPPIQDQLSLGSCTANAVAAAHQYEQTQRGEPGFPPSRLFIYYNTRLIEGTVRYDAGGSIRDAIKSVARYGVCDEAEWEYDISRYRTRPPKREYKAAMKNQVLVYRRVERDLVGMRACLASGFPFVFGFTVYSSFVGEDVAATGDVPMPAGRETALGGHAVLCVGHNDEEGKFKCRNSWGTDWGNAGHFYMPYEYLMNANLSDDFWIIMVGE